MPYRQHLIRSPPLLRFRNTIITHIFRQIPIIIPMRHQACIATNTLQREHFLIILAILFIPVPMRKAPAMSKGLYQYRMHIQPGVSVY